MSVTVTEIADVALKLCGFADSPVDPTVFKEKFAFAFDLLVDADIQLQNLQKKIGKNGVIRRNSGSSQTEHRR